MLEEVNTSGILPCILTQLTLHPRLSIRIKAYNVYCQDMLDDYYTFLCDMVKANLVNKCLERLTVSTIKLINYYNVSALVDIASSTESLVI